MPAATDSVTSDGILSAVPVLRMYDVDATKRFYLSYLGCHLDWHDGEGDRPIYLQVSRAGLTLHLSSHHDDGTPGSVVLVVTTHLNDLHTELSSRGYPFLNPGIEDGPAAGRVMQLIDPASNRIRFYEGPTAPRQA